MRRPRILSLTLLLAVTTACGSTVPLSQQAGSSSSGGAVDGGSSLAVGQGPSQGGTTGDLQAGGAGTPNSPGGGSALTSTSGGREQGTASTGGTAPGGTAGSAGTTGSSASTIPAKGKGWDAQYVYVGVTTQKDAQKTFGSFGFTGIDPGDTEAQAKSVIAKINARGGLFGRKVKPVFKDVPLLDSAQNPDTYASQVCTFFSQDSPVVAVVNIVLTMDTDNFRACFAKAHIALFNAELTATDQTVQSKLNGYLYTTIVPTWDAFAPVFVSRLTEEGYFKGWDSRLQTVTSTKPKVGVLVVDNPLGARTAKIIVKALKAQGYPDVLTFAYTYPGSQIDGAIQYFAGNGVTHVISSDIELPTFQMHASAQQYYPRYSVNTNNNPLALAKYGGVQSQTGGVGVGWAPGYDVEQAQDPGIWSSGEKACLDAMKDGQVTNKTRLSVTFALSICDGLELFAHGAAAGKGFTPAAVRSGIDAIGPSFSPASSFASAIRSGRSFLPGGTRALAWSKPCGCYNYVSRQTVKF